VRCFFCFFWNYRKQNSRIKREQNEPQREQQFTPHERKRFLLFLLILGETEQQNNNPPEPPHIPLAGVKFILLGFFWSEQIQQNKSHRAVNVVHRGGKIILLF